MKACRADSEEMETPGVAQPPCVYAEGPSISSHVIKNPKFFRTQKRHVGKGLGRGPEC